MSLQGWLFVGAVGCLVTALVDNISLRAQLRRRIRDQAKMTVDALGGTAKCTDKFCEAFRSVSCDGGRCRYHCRLGCECKGNK